jgi:tRNA-splicing ligase RtcB
MTDQDELKGVGPVVRQWLTDPLSPEAAKLVERLTRVPDVRRIAIMPDVHAGHDVCNGAVIGTSTLLYPQAVGADIGCGMSTMRFHGEGLDLATRTNILRRMQRKLRVLTRDPVYELPDAGRLSDVSLQKAAGRDGHRELGTLGRGNHFVELQLDESEAVWVLVHSGSRIMGQLITTHHLRRATAMGTLAALDAASDDGVAYLADVEWAVEFAAANRRALVGDMARILGEFGLAPDEPSYFTTTHNLVRAETHHGERLFVHRKGAATAGLHERGVIPGSAATSTVHTEGRGDSDSMCSSSHGAGRVRSRSQARREVSAHRLTREMGEVLFDRSAATRLTDEAPSVYRNLRKVMAAQRELVKITRTLRPVISFKGA